MLQAVIFDLDGVLVDSHPAHLLAWKALFRSLGKEFSDRELQFVLEGQTREEILRHFLGSLSPEKMKSLGETKQQLFGAFSMSLRAIPGVRRIIEELRASDVPIGVASSAARSRADSMLEQLDLKTHVQVVTTAQDVGKGKPDPAIFHLAASRLQVEPEQALVCEDAVPGVLAAKRAGMKCLGIAANGRAPLLCAAGADRVITDFSAIRLSDLRQLFAPAGQ